jgi:hypothetical protein
LDYSREMALVAQHDGITLGVARYRSRGHSCIRDRRKTFERSLAGNKSH